MQIRSLNNVTILGTFIATMLAMAITAVDSRGQEFDFYDGEVLRQGTWRNLPSWPGLEEVGPDGFYVSNLTTYSQWDLIRIDGERFDDQPEWSFRVRVTIEDEILGEDVFFGIGSIADNFANVQVAAVRETWDGESTLEARTGQNGQTNRSADVPYSIVGDEIVLQVDAFGNEVIAYVWKEGESVVQQSHPFIPAITYPTFGISRGSATIHEMWISESPIPLPSFVVGDFNSDGILDAQDIDLLTSSMRDEFDSTFDLDDNGTVDQTDHTIWVKDLKNMWFGDANLDGEFSSSDFVSVFNTGKFETGQDAGWSEGDWNGDGVFSSGDFVKAFQDGGYELGPRNAKAAAVPEPSGIVGLLSSTFLFALLLRRKAFVTGNWGSCFFCNYQATPSKR